MREELAERDVCRLTDDGETHGADSAAPAGMSVVSPLARVPDHHPPYAFRFMSCLCALRWAVVEGRAVTLAG